MEPLEPGKMIEKFVHLKFKDFKLKLGEESPGLKFDFLNKVYFYRILH